MPKVSVVVPLYNARRYVDRCIVSILQQSLSDFEAIFVDDGSTDGSPLVVKQFARNDSRIILKSHEQNRGPGAARNTGVAFSKSSYVTFVDSDDFIAPNLFEIMLQASDYGRFDIVETGCLAIDELEHIEWEYIPEPMQIECLGADPGNIFRMREWGMHQKLWRKSLFQADVRFPEGVYWEDIAVVPSLIVDATSMVKVDFVGYNYVQRSGSITNTRSVKHVLDLFRAFDFFENHLKKRGIVDRYRDTLIRTVETCSRYFVRHMRLNNRSDPESSDRLIRLCEILEAEYLNGKLILEKISDRQFEDIVARVSGGTISTALRIDGEFEHLVRHSLETIHDN